MEEKTLRKKKNVLALNVGYVIRNERVSINTTTSKEFLIKKNK